MGELFDSYDGLGVAGLIRRGEVSTVEVMDEAIARIERCNPELNAVVIREFERGRSLALAMRDERPANPPPLWGLPLLVKDLSASWAGVRTTNGSLRMRDFVAPADSAQVARLRAAGLILVGKTNVPEHGLIAQSKNRVFGTTANPWSRDHTPGGSSGGSAAAVAAGMLPFAHASDGGGSIRMPASNCGVFGLKPTRGRVSMEPDYVDAWLGAAIDGAVSVSVRDSAAFLDAIASPSSLYNPPAQAMSFLNACELRVGRLTIGVPRRIPGVDDLHPDVVEVWRGTVALLERLGHRIEEFDYSPDHRTAFETFRGAVSVSIAQVERLLDQMGFPILDDADASQMVQESRRMAETMSAPDYAEVVQAWRQTGREVLAATAPFDAVVLPTQMRPPTTHDFIDLDRSIDDFVEPIFAQSAMTFAFNMSGQPAMSIPAGFTKTGPRLPVGVQFVAGLWREPLLFRLAVELENALDWSREKPPVHASR